MWCGIIPCGPARCSQKDALPATTSGREGIYLVRCLEHQT